MGRQRLKTAALLLAVFIAGGLGGAALERRLPDDPGGDERRSSSRSSLVTPPTEIPRYYRALDLSEEQRAEIERIMEAARPESDSILSVAMPRLRQITRNTREAIADVLTEEQREQLNAEFRRRRSEGGRDGRDDAQGGRDRRGDGPDGSTGRNSQNR
jgi:hypothetical protein